MTPDRLARDSGVSPKRDLNSASSIAAKASTAGFTSSARGVNAGSVEARENLTFQGHTSWEVCRQNHFEIPLATGWRTLKKPDG